jgi:hypothetical protein
MVNTGCHKDAAAAEKLFDENFSQYDFSEVARPTVIRATWGGHTFKIIEPAHGDV